jgi:hypothetical protein
MPFVFMKQKVAMELFFAHFSFHINKFQSQKLMVDEGFSGLTEYRLMLS